MKPLAIVGLDPGTTSAYCVLGLDGQIIKVYSAKNLSLSGIISQVLEVSQPVVVGTDKAKRPFLVEEFSRKLGTKLITPPEDLGREEKKVLIQAHFPGHKNGSHESDALASALFAFRKIQPKLKKIESFILEHDLGEKKVVFTQLAVKEDLNFHQLKDILTKPAGEEGIIKPVIAEERLTKKDYLSLYQKFSRLKEGRKQLEEERARLQEELTAAGQKNLHWEKKSDYFHRKLEALFKFKEERIRLQAKELQKKNEEIFSLKQEIFSLYRFVGKTPRFQLIKKLSTLSRDEFEKKKEILDIKEGDFLMVKQPQIHSPEVIRKLSQQNITLIVEKILPIIDDSFSTAAILPGRILAENEFFALADEKSFEKHPPDINHLVKEYREKRRRELG